MKEERTPTPHQRPYSAFTTQANSTRAKNFTHAIPSTANDTFYNRAKEIDELSPSPASYNNIIDTIGKHVNVSSIKNTPKFSFNRNKKEYRIIKSAIKLNINPERLKLLKTSPNFSFTKGKRFRKHFCSSTLKITPNFYGRNSLMQATKSGVIGSAIRFTQTRPVSPGPAFYEITRYKALANKTIPINAIVGTFGTSKLINKREKSPGPGAYEHCNSYRQFVSFTKSKRNMNEVVECPPGPGQYALFDASQYKMDASKKYSFGHSPKTLSLKHMAALSKSFTKFSSIEKNRYYKSKNQNVG